MKKLDYRISKAWFDFGQRNIRFWEFISLRGLYILLAFAVVHLIVFWADWYLAFLPVITMSVAFILTLLIRTVIHRKRPNFKGSTYRAWLNSYSFPSAHASVAFGLACGLILGFDLLFPLGFSLVVVVFFIGYASLISLSRLALGVHYASDVFVGTLLGVTVSFLIFFL